MAEWWQHVGYAKKPTASSPKADRIRFLANGEIALYGEDGVVRLVINEGAIVSHRVVTK